MKRNLIFSIILLATLMPCKVMAGSFIDDLQMRARLGYNIGGTTPLGLPNTIRSIDSYSLTPSFMIGLDVQYPLNEKWGIQAGLHMENKAMDGDVTTKAYRMEVKKGESVLDGLFTGKVHQEVKMWMATIPIQATYTLSSKVQLKAGPYFSVITSKDFSGIASDGYLRQGDPVGPKIIMGNKEGEWATYDFDDDMRDFQVGIGVGADWQFYKGLGMSVDLNWGLNGIFKSDFKTVEQTLYPIYGTIGFFYRLK